jgi:cobalt/nickel transport system ATP-binding protein
MCCNDGPEKLCGSGVSEQSAPAFELSDVNYAYRAVTAIAGLSLRIEIGQRIVLLGANGSGKSTLLRLLDALYFPAAGTISAFGEPLTEKAFQDEGFALRFRRRVGFVFQNADVQLFNPSVFDELAFGPLQLGWEKYRIRSAVTEMLEFMALSHLRDRPPHRLSGGEKKRVALACVLISDPDVLLLDEPTVGLDPESQSQIIDLLVGWGDGAKTVITATHNLDLVPDIADDCYVLQAGRLAAHAPPAEILYDEELLGQTRLIHAHRHVHADGQIHSHHHLHRHGHSHKHER